MARMLHVKEYNRIMHDLGQYIMIMTSGNGSMIDNPRVRGWVVFESPSLGDCHDFAKWLPNHDEAVKEYKLRVHEVQHD